MIKLLPCNLMVMGSSHGKSLLQCNGTLRTIDPFPKPCIGKSFVYRVALLEIKNEIIVE